MIDRFLELLCKDKSISDSFKTAVLKNEKKNNKDKESSKNEK